jgi:hypothetical protein
MIPRKSHRRLATFEGGHEPALLLPGPSISHVIGQLGAPLGTRPDLFERVQTSQ